MPPVSILIKPASGLCNLRCRYCFYTDEMNNRNKDNYGIMTEDILEIVIKKLLEFADQNCTIAFQGGEPTLTGLDFYKKCLEFEKNYNIKNVEIHHAIQTNGYALTREWCDFFAENHFLVGVSIDGIKATHDIYRKDACGCETYLRVLESTRLLKEANVDFNILTVVNAKTAGRIRRIYENYKKHGFGYQQYIACLDPIGQRQGQEEYSLTPEMYGDFLIELFHLWEIDLYKGEQPYIRQFENYLAILLGMVPEGCEHKGICSVQNTIEADGSVYPCDFYVLDEYKLGNLTTDSFETIYQRRIQQNFIQSSNNHTDKCRKCKWFMLCRGGCRRHREQPGTALGENYFCKSYQLFFEACYPNLCQITDRMKGR